MTELVIQIASVMIAAALLAIVLGWNILIFYKEPTTKELRSFIVKTILLNVFALFGWIVVYIIIFTLMLLRGKSFREIVVLLKKRSDELNSFKNLE